MQFLHYSKPTKTLWHWIYQRVVAFHHYQRLLEPIQNLWNQFNVFFSNEVQIYVGENCAIASLVLTRKDGQLICLQ